MGTNERKRRLFVKQIVLIVGLLVLGVVGFRTLELERHREATIGVVFDGAAGKRSPEFILEIAADAPARTKGLMFRKADSIPDNGGMIFIFPEDEKLSFWMRNTVTSLDMLFLDKDLKVQGILKNVPIMNEEPRTLGLLGRYVIELKAGTADKHGISPGDAARPSRPLPRGR